MIYGVVYATRGFTQHRGITWIFKIAIEVIFHKIEKAVRWEKRIRFVWGFRPSVN